MALNIRNPEASRLAAELAGLAGESKTDAVILALQAHLADRLDQIALRCASRSIRDTHTSEQILGYDAQGLPS